MIKKINVDPASNNEATSSAKSVALVGLAFVVLTLASWVVSPYGILNVSSFVIALACIFFSILLKSSVHFKVGILKILTAAAIIWISTSIFSFFFIHWHDYNQFKNSLDEFATNHTPAIQQEIFTDLFSEAEKCSQFDLHHAKNAQEMIELEEKGRECYASVHTMLSNIQEKNNWHPYLSQQNFMLVKPLKYGFTPPMSGNIFFIKVTPEKTQILGWNGKLENLPHQPEVIAIKESNFRTNFKQNQECRTFQGIRYSGCQIFTSIELPQEGSRGYLFSVEGSLRSFSFIGWALVNVPFDYLIVPLLSIVGLFAQATPLDSIWGMKRLLLNLFIFGLPTIVLILIIKISPLKKPKK